MDKVNAGFFGSCVKFGLIHDGKQRVFELVEKEGVSAASDKVKEMNFIIGEFDRDLFFYLLYKCMFCVKV
jgi:hypothetical protein